MGLPWPVLKSKYSVKTLSSGARKIREIFALHGPLAPRAPANVPKVFLKWFLNSTGPQSDTYNNRIEQLCPVSKSR